MKRSKFTEEQITYALRQHDAGTPVGDICRQLGVSAASFYAWKRRWCMNRNWPATNPTHRSITYQERTTMAYRARPSG